MDAFDADVLIFAASGDHDLGPRVRALIVASSSQHPEGLAGIGSTLLLPEVLSKPLREGDEAELGSLVDVLARVDLRPVDVATAELAVALGATYRLRAVDAVHLATAVAAGATRFITNNRRDFATSIAEIDVTYPDSLPENPF